MTTLCFVFGRTQGCALSFFVRFSEKPGFCGYFLGVRTLFRYAVRESDKSHIIEGLFVVGPDMLTGRGLTVGDSTSTAELLYGAPDKIEVNYSGGTVRSVYIYFLKFRKNMLLIYLEDGKVSSISAISYNKDNPGTAG